jgi:hypothetical protein
MGWKLEGTYFENCNCQMICHCATSGMTEAGDEERCQVVLVFHVERGEVDGVDVGGLSVGMAADAPGLMSSGNWRVGLFVDEKASPQQAEALAGVLGGQKGGLFAGLAPLVGENRGMVTAPIEFADDGRRHRVKIGDVCEMEVEDFVSAFDATGKGIHVSGVGFPVDTLAAGRAVKSRMSAFGMSFDGGEGKNSFSAPFSLSA